MGVSSVSLKQMAQRFTSQPAGYLLSKASLVVLAIILLLSAWSGQTILVIVLGLLLSAAGLAKVWSQFSLKNVHCQRSINEHRVFPGESVKLTLHLSNKKMLPLPWVDVVENVPVRLVPQDSTNGNSSGTLKESTSLLWYSKTSWQYDLHCRKRGYYTLGPLTVTSGDIFGLYSRSAVEPLQDNIIVYPKIFPINRLDLPAVYPLGDAKAERRIFEDPIRVIGVRDYSPRDSLRYIHWKATARQQSLQVKVFEPTTTLTVALFFVADSFGPSNEEDFELGISTVASLANYLVEMRDPVGVYSNTRLADSQSAIKVRPGTGINQLVNILEALAKITPEIAAPFNDFIDEHLINLPWGTTLIFIIGSSSEQLVDLFTHLKEARHKLMVFQVSGQSLESNQSLNWHSARETFMGVGQ